MYDFFTAHPNMTRIARHCGTGKANGNTGYTDDTTPVPFGNNAWALFRFNATTQRPFDVYVFIQAYDVAPSFGANAPGTPGKIVGSQTAPNN